MIKKTLFLFLIYLSYPLLASAELLQDLYSDIGGYSLDKDEIRYIKDKGCDATYGEITFASAAQLFKALNLTKNDVFYDLGCGVGKLVMQAYLTTPIKKSVGIELSPSRFKLAEKAKLKLTRANKLINGKELIFYLSDMLAADLNDATAIYISSLCFPVTLMQKLVTKLSKLKKGLKILTLSKLPSTKNIILEKTFELPMSWSNSTTVYLYRVV